MKRLLSLLLAVMLVMSTAVPAYATGDGNFDSGGSGMGDGTKTNYWNPGMDGVRVSIVDAASRSVVRTPIDLTNKRLRPISHTLERCPSSPTMQGADCP